MMVPMIRMIHETMVAIAMMEMVRECRTKKLSCILCVSLYLCLLLYHKI